MTAGSPTLTNLTATTTTYGIFLTNLAAPTFNGCTIASASNTGIYLNPSGASTPTITIQNCVVRNSSICG